jgi:hypothetical protein
MAAISMVLTADRIEIDSRPRLIVLARPRNGRLRVFPNRLRDP